MLIKGSFKRESEKITMLNIPALCVNMSLHPKDNVADLTKELIEQMAKIYLKKTLVIEVTIKNSQVLIKSEQVGIVLALILKFQRETHDISHRELAKKMGLKAHSILTRYESCEVEPSFERVQQILKACGAELIIDCKNNQAA